MRQFAHFITVTIFLAALLCSLAFGWKILALSMFVVSDDGYAGPASYISSWTGIGIPIALLLSKATPIQSVANAISRRLGDN